MAGNRVEVRGQAERFLNNPDLDNGIATSIWLELESFHTGYREPAVAPREVGIHKIRVGGDRVAKLSIDRRSPGSICVDLIKVYRLK